MRMASVERRAVGIAMPAALAAMSMAIASTLPAQALASCDGADALLRQAYPAADHGPGGLVLKSDTLLSINPESVVCKVWPYRSGLVLAAVPLLEAAPPVEGENKGDVEIIVFDRATGAPLARRVERGMAFSDAIQFGRLGLDTARYDMAADRRAFGLRTSQRGSSGVNPYGEQALWLYTFDGTRIDRVLDGLIVDRTNGEIDDRCEGSSTTVKRTVRFAPRGQAGNRHLLVKETVTQETLVKAGDDCQWNKHPGVDRQFRLTYGDSKYRLPPAVKPRSSSDASDNEIFSSITIESGEPRK